MRPDQLYHAVRSIYSELVVPNGAATGLPVSHLAHVGNAYLGLGRGAGSFEPAEGCRMTSVSGVETMPTTQGFFGSWSQVSSTGSSTSALLPDSQGLDSQSSDAYSPPVEEASYSKEVNLFSSSDDADEENAWPDGTDEEELGGQWANLMDTPAGSQVPWAQANTHSDKRHHDNDMPVMAPMAPVAPVDELRDMPLPCVRGQWANLMDTPAGSQVPWAQDNTHSDKRHHDNDMPVMAPMAPVAPVDELRGMPLPVDTGMGHDFEDSNLYQPLLEPILEADAPLFRARKAAAAVGGDGRKNVTGRVLPASSNARARGGQDVKANDDVTSDDVSAELDAVHLDLQRLCLKEALPQSDDVSAELDAVHLDLQRLCLNSIHNDLIQAPQTMPAVSAPAPERSNAVASSGATLEAPPSGEVNTATHARNERPPSLKCYIQSPPKGPSKLVGGSGSCPAKVGIVFLAPGGEVLVGTKCTNTVSEEHVQVAPKNLSPSLRVEAITVPEICSTGIFSSDEIRSVPIRSTEIEY